MMFPVSTLFLVALVFNAASTLGAPLRIPDTSSVTPRSEDSSSAAPAPVVAKFRVRILSERGTPYLKPVTKTEVKAHEEPQLVRRYPRKVYYDLYEKREPEPATTVKVSTVVTTKMITFDSPADAIAFAEALGTSDLVISCSETTSCTDTAATPTATVCTEASTSTPVPATSATETGSVTPTPTDSSVVPTGTPTATTTDTLLPTTSPTGTVSVAPTLTDPSVIPTGTTDTPLPTTSPTGTVSVTPTSTDPSAIPTGTPIATTTDTPLPTTSPTGTVSVTPTSTDPSIIPTGATETTPAPTASGTFAPDSTPLPTASGTDVPPTTATGAPSAPPATPDPAHKPSALGRRHTPETLPGRKSLGDELHADVATAPTTTKPLTGAALTSRNPHEARGDTAVTLSGRQLASSGATLASAMRRRDLSDHLNK